MLWKAEPLQACALASDLLRSAGFEARHVSRLSEAVYYALPGRAQLMRVAAHPKAAQRNGFADNVVAKLTFTETLRRGKIARLTAQAIGVYMMKSAQ